jgi:uncharacterized protein (DUF2252 family)
VWDVKRLAASFVIAARDRAFARADQRRVATTAVRQYRVAMRQAAAARNLDVWYVHADADTVMERLSTQFSARRLKKTQQVLAKARTRDSLRAFSKLTTIVDGQPRIVGDPPLIVPVMDLAEGVEREQIEEGIRTIIRQYRRTLSSERRHLLEQFHYVDMARKVVGVGSVGTRAWIVLMLGRDDQDPLFLQAKEAGSSVLEPFIARSEYTNSGQRVVAGQRLMQTVSDIFLGWQRVVGVDGQERDFYIRQLHDWKGSAEIETMDPDGMTAYAQLCGWTLARAHARSGDRVAISSYLGAGAQFDDAVATFSEAYADQNERDYQALVDAVESGRVVAQAGL